MKPDIVSAVMWGFRAVLANATLWVLGTLVFMAAFFLLVIASAGINAASAESVSVGFEFGIATLSVVVAPIVLRFMLMQVDKPSTSWRDLGKDVPYLPTIGVAFVTGLVLTLAMVLALIGPIIGMIRMAGNGTTMSEGEVFAQVVGSMGIMFLIVLASILIMPLYAYMQWCAADGHGFVPSLRKGFEIGRTNYWRALGFQLLTSVIVFCGTLVTLGIGAVVIGPALQLATGHFYRQLVGGQIPVEGRKP